MMAIDDDTILVDRRAGYRVITLNRPQRLNAFTVPMHRVLAAAITDAEQDQDCRALLLTGAGRAFCSGQDLNERVLPSGEVVVPGEALGKYYNPLVLRLRELPFPVICAVNGIAAGAGLNIALACDIVLAARSATFTQVFARLGLVPDAGGTWLLPRLVGQARARGLALLAEPLTAEQAEQWGLIWKVVDDATLMSEAEKLCTHFASAPTFGLGLIKRALDAAEGNDLATQLDLERELQREAGSTADYKEAVRAFLGKRKPAFTGKR
jgi:2-(1,2-epoxy-1,2-dihydrophenyl)acetyl-CoA isomerase